MYLLPSFSLYAAINKDDEVTLSQGLLYYELRPCLAEKDGSNSLTEKATARKGL
jgi:hypothetical protein